MTSTALLTDHYELTMVQAALRSGAAERRCVFEVFARSLPGRRRYGVMAGIGRLLELLPAFRFDEAALDFLAAAKVVDETTCEWLAGFRFTGSIEAFRAQVDALGADTTLLVDTYDVEQGIRTAVEVAGTGLGAIRLDSGDLVSLAQSSRRLLDSLGATQTRIIVTSDLDENSIARL